MGVQKEVPAIRTLPDVSIIIPSLNALTIKECLTYVQAQTHKNSIREILVVGLDEPKLVQENDLVRFISTRHPVCAAAARNIGIKQAQGEVLCFLDADCFATPNWLGFLLTAYQHGHQIVGGGINFSSKNYWTLSDNISMFHEFLITKKAGFRPYHPTLNLLLACNVIHSVGLMDESFPGASGEDIDWTIRMRRAGYSIYFEPRAVVHHCPNRGTLNSVWQHWWHSGQNMIRVRRTYPTEYGKYAFLYDRHRLRLLSPLIAAMVAVNIYRRDRHLLKYLHTFPVTFLTKVAWCWGAAASLN